MFINHIHTLVIQNWLLKSRIILEWSSVQGVDQEWVDWHLSSLLLKESVLQAFSLETAVAFSVAMYTYFHGSLPHCCPVHITTEANKLIRYLKLPTPYADMKPQTRALLIFHHTTQQKLPCYSDIYFMSYWCNSNNIMFFLLL